MIHYRVLLKEFSVIKDVFSITIDIVDRNVKFIKRRPLYITLQIVSLIN